MYWLEQEYYSHWKDLVKHLYLICLCMGLYWRMKCCKVKLIEATAKMKRLWYLEEDYKLWSSKELWAKGGFKFILGWFVEKTCTSTALQEPRVPEVKPVGASAIKPQTEQSLMDKNGHTWRILSPGESESLCSFSLAPTLFFFLFFM